MPPDAPVAAPHAAIPARPTRGPGLLLPSEGPAQGSAEGAEDHSQAMATWAASLLAPIAAELGEARQTIERQADELGGLREERGRLSVGLVEMTVRLVEAKAEREAAESSRRRVTRLLALALCVLCALALVAGTVAATGWLR